MRLLSCLLILLLPGLAGAAPKAARACRILFLGAPDNAPATTHLFDGKVSREVELPQMSFSPVYPLPAGALVLRMIPSAAEDPAKIDPAAPHAKLGEGVKDLYLLVFSDPSNKIVPLRMQVVDANPERFRKGQMLWFNLTPNLVGGKVGSRKLLIKANSQTILDAPATGNEDYPVNISYQIPGREQVYPLCETKWLHDPRSRNVLFIVAREGSRTPRILGFPDFRGEEQPSRDGS